MANLFTIMITQQTSLASNYLRGATHQRAERSIMNISALPESFITPLVTWHKSQRIARLIHKIEREYIGCEVLEQLPFGGDIKGLIVKMEWDDTCYNRRTGELGTWMCLVRYWHDGSQGWIGNENLALTGVKVADVDAAREIHPMYK